MNRCRILALTAVLLASFALSVHGQEWTRFRGPNGTGISKTTTLPTTWSNSDYNWKTKLPGKGHSSPVVWGNKVFLLSADPRNATRYVLCVSAESGKIVWQREYESKTHRLHRFSSYASCTPAVDADRVYFAWSTPTTTTMMAMDHDGKVVWSKDLGRWQSQHGYGTSPMLYKDLVIVNNSQQGRKLRNGEQPGESYVIAFDRKTGDERWRRKSKSSNVSYAVPCIYRRKGAADQLIVCNSTEGMFSLNPMTGKDNWLLPVFERRTVSSPVVMGDLVFGSNGSGGGGNFVVAVRPYGEPEVRFKVDRSAPYVPSAVQYNELAFLFADSGIVTCINHETGKVQYRERLKGAAFYGSPVRAGKTLYCVDHEGNVFVVAASARFKLLSKIPLGEECRSTPAISGGRLFLRTTSHLMCVGAKSL